MNCAIKINLSVNSFLFSMTSARNLLDAICVDSSFSPFYPENQSRRKGNSKNMK